MNTEYELEFEEAITTIERKAQEETLAITTDLLAQTELFKQAA